MPVNTLYTLEESNITVSGGGQLSGITSGSGLHLVGLNITLDNNDWVAVDLDDPDDTNFNDNDPSQALDTAITYDGASYAAGLRVEAEYSVTVEDPDGNTYELVAFNINEVGTTNLYSTVEGLAFIGGSGGFPPIGVPLTVIGATEEPSNPFAAHATPICLTKDVRISIPNGTKKIEDLLVGDEVVTKDNGVQVIRWIGRSAFSSKQLAQNPKLSPVRISAGALGCGLPHRDLVISRQHRMMFQSKIADRMFGHKDALVSAIRMTELPGVYVDDTFKEVEYFHLLFDKHEIIYAEGAMTESLFTGPEALKAVAPQARREILEIIPEIANLSYQSKPASLIPTARMQRKLVARHAKNSKPCVGSLTVNC